MSAISLNAEALRGLFRITGALNSRSYRVPGFEGRYSVHIVLKPEAGTHTNPPEESRRPSHGECAEVIGEMFRHLLVPGGAISTVEKTAHRRAPLQDVSERVDGPGPDIAGAWQEYREQLGETAGIHLCPWVDLDSQIQEAFASAIWHVLDARHGSSSSSSSKGGAR